MKKFAKKLCCTVLALSLVLSVMTGFQYKSVNVSAEETVDDPTYERLEGDEDAGKTPKSMVYSMTEKNSTATFHVTAITNVYLFLDLYQGDNYVTVTTENSAWTYPPQDKTTIDIKSSDGFFQLQQGQKYVITVKRKDYAEAGENRTDYDIIVKNSATNEICVSFYAKNTVLTGDVSMYLMARMGTFEMTSDSVPKSSQNHGTDRTKQVSLSAVNNTPPEDYVIPDGLVQDAKDKKYEQYFPKDSIQTVSVEMDENNLNYMLQHAPDKPSVMTNRVTIGDTTLGYAGIKTKGNYTLAETNKTTSDRFSFTLNFGKYVKKKQYGAKQNFYGCQKISFNNCFFDKTIMKEYNAMRLMDEMGIPTPQYSLAKLYINNRYYGVYFMVEAMDLAIIERYQNASSKEVSDYLTKPYYTNMTYYFDDQLEQCLAGKADHEFTMDALNQAGLLFQKSDGTYEAGGVLRDNYSGIWEGQNDTLQDVAPMIPKVLTWNRKVQLLSEGKDFDGNVLDVNSQKYLELLETVMDTDEATRYFATHSFLVQTDNMFTWRQNYGLYVDEQGKSLFVPWDYDLAWGTANWGEDNTSEETANWDIDKMYPDNFVHSENPSEYGTFSKDEIYRRAPLFHVIWQNKKLLEKYHTYISDCAKLVSLGGTTSDGKKVEPARFAKTTETYYSQVTEVAKTENLGKDIYYVGEIKQPDGAKEGIPALKKLVARRAVGVWLQTQGKKADVTGYDCDIQKLGTNFLPSGKKLSVTGTFTVVDEDTGIFATVTYPNSNKEAWIRTEEISEGDTYQKISGKMIDQPVVYKIEFANAESLTSDYKLYIPVSPEKENVEIYSYSASTGGLQELKAETYDNVYCVTGSDLSYIVIGKADASSVTPAPTPTPSVEVGSTIVSGKLKYKVTKAGTNEKGEVSLIGTSKKKSDKSFTSLTIGSELKSNGKSYKITSIGKNAFSGYAYLKSVTIGKNVSEIKSNAFSKCSKLQKITIKTNLLTAKKVGTQAFKGIHAKAVIKVPAAKVKSYTKILRARGVGAKAKITK